MRSTALYNSHREPKNRGRPAVHHLPPVGVLALVVGRGRRVAPAPWSRRRTAPARPSSTASGSTNEILRLENESYREATGELTDQISSLQTALTQLSEQAELDPATKAALDKLPRGAAVAGHGRRRRARRSAPTRAVDGSPESTFGILSDLLGVARRSARVGQDEGREPAGAARARRRRSGRSPAGCRRLTATGRIRSPARRTSIPASTSRPIAARRSRDRRRHGRVGRLQRQLRQPGPDRPRLRHRDAVRSPVALRRRAGPDRSSAATSSATSARPAAPPARTCTTRSC